MVRLRFQKVGRPHTPHFRLVAIEKTRARDAACLEVLGHYHPKATSDKITVNVERLRHWMKNGALLSESALSILKQTGLWAQAQAAA